MNKKNLVYLIFAIFFAFTLLPLTTFALTYNESGEWFDYVGGLDSEYYKEDLLKSSTNLDFETSFNLAGTSCISTDPVTGDTRLSNFCKVQGGPRLTGDMWFTNSTNFVYEGSYSGRLRIETLSGASGTAFNQAWILRDFRDSNTSFYILSGGGTLSYVGYFNDSNSFTSISDIRNFDGVKSYLFDETLGNNLGFRLETDSAYVSNVIHIDDVDIIRTNSGTFYQGTTAPFCSSKESCSNITDSSDLNNNAVTKLYWVLDYVSDASCSVYENDVFIGSAVEMDNGYYYHEIETLGTDSRTDLNLRASCDKVPYVTKGFATNMELGTAGDIDSVLSVGNDGTDNVAYRGDLVNFYAEYDAEFGGPILNADCNIQIASDTYEMTYNSSTERYEYSQYFIDNGVYSIYTNCESDTYSDLNESYNLTITDPLSDTLIFTPISNVGSYSISDTNNIVSISKSTSADEFSFSLLSSASNSISFSWNDKRSKKQYYIYTSDDGEEWVFNDSFTYGSGDYNSGVQKILLNSNQYNYSFSDSISASETKYYRFVYKDVAGYWETINSSEDWIKNSLVTNTRDYSLLADYDLINDSNYSNVEILSNDYYPELTSSDLNTPFEFQFTAFANEETTLEVGFKTDDGVETTNTIYVGTDEQKYSIPIDPDDFDSRIFITSNENTSSRVYVRDYVIIPKAYFVSRLNVFDEAGEDLSAILNNGLSVIYAQEGKDLVFNTKAFDMESNLQTLRIQALIGSTIVNTKDFALDNELENVDDFYEWSEKIVGVIDRNGYYNNPSTFVDLTFKATLINSLGEEVSEQFKTIKLMPYPYFSNDIDLFVSPLTNKVGENPAFRFNLNQKAPEQFKGLRVRLWDSSSSLEDPDYDEYIYNTDLDCGANCLRNIVLDDFVFESEDNYKAQFTLLLGTEVENTDNPLTNFVSSFYVNYKEFETARILQVFERNDLTYRNDEPIPVVLQIRDVPFIDLKDRTEVYLTLDICSSDTGVCDSNGITQFKPKFHYYDSSTGYNYYYWNNLFYEDDGSLLQDSNYIRLKGHIIDQYYGHDETELPIVTLGSKCADGDFNDIGSFLYNFFLGDITGCTTTASSKIEVGDAEETRILIDQDHVLTGSTNQSLACVKPNNEDYVDTFKQDLFCGVVYRRSEIPIDSFKISVGNDATDWSKTGLTKQYLEFVIPSEEVLFNDPFMLKQALNSKYDTSIDTIGEVFYYSVDDLFTGIANPLTEIPTALTDAGIVKNINFDVNWDGQLDPSVVTGFFFFNLEGLEVENQYNYISLFPELETLNPSEFREFALRENLFLPKNETIVSVFASDLKQVSKFKTSSPLVIYSKPSENNVNVVNDENLSSKAIPKQFNFSLLSDMFYNNGKNHDRIQIPLSLSTIISAPFNLGSITGSFNALIENPMNWFKDTWFILFIAFCFVVVISLVYKNFKGNGS